MKRYKKNGYQKAIAIKSGIVIAIIALPLGFVGYYFGLMNSAADFTFKHAPDPETFLPLNETQLSGVVDDLGARYSMYHMPLNQSVSAEFVNDSLDFGGEISYTNVSRYRHSDNHALWTGVDYAGWTFQYLAAAKENDTAREEFALSVLLNLTTGLSMMMEVPNGGLGPEYGGILARGYAPPDAQDIWPEIFTDRFKHANGTGAYSNWRYRGYTSNDEFAGYYLFLVMATRYLGHVEEIQEKVSLIVDQICTSMLANDFLGIHTTGATSGIDQKPLVYNGGFWAPLLLKLGSIHHPAKYLRLYHHHVANEMFFLSNAEGSRTNILGAYYPYNFGSAVVLAFLLLEDPGTEIWRHFFKGYLNSIWSFTRHHRNAWVNAIFLMICHEKGIDAETIGENSTLISLDVQDQLQRFVNQHYPTYHRATPPVPTELYKIMSPEDILGGLGLDEELSDILGLKEHQFVDRPLTAEYIRPRRWLWSRNPFHIETRGDNVLRMESGASLTVPYWMMRYMGEIEGEAM